MHDRIAPEQQRLLDDLLRLCGQLCRAFPGESVPCFAHLRIAPAGPADPGNGNRGGRFRDVFLGLRTLNDPAATVLHWQTAPLSAVFFNSCVGEEYELEVGGRSLEGTVLARSLLTQLSQLHAQGREVTSEDVVRGLQMLKHDQNTAVKEVLQDAVVVASKSRPVIPKSVAQQRYLDAIRNEDIVFGIGPAGTGKTYLAMAMAVKALLEKQVRRIVLCRPAVEAGEKLGFLPGSMQDKVNPYLRPLYDALNDLLDMERAQLLMDRGQIEVAPLAFMRGRTLNDSFVILDEAQNTTGEQMKMFLTRLGYDSKAVITGDITQVDLPARTTSGLVEVTRILGGIPGIEFVRFSEVDVVRHPLVAAIISAYDRAADHGDRGPGRAAFRDGERDHDPTAGRPTERGDALDELEPPPGSDGDAPRGSDAG